MLCTQTKRNSRLTNSYLHSLGGVEPALMEFSYLNQIYFVLFFILLAPRYHFEWVQSNQSGTSAVVSYYNLTLVCET